MQLQFHCSQIRDCHEIFTFSSKINLQAIVSMTKWRRFQTKASLRYEATQN